MMQVMQSGLAVLRPLTERAGRPELVNEVPREIELIARDVPVGSSILVTGSIVEGLGNPSSDIDIFVVLPEGSRGRPTAIGIRPDSYVDCEYFTLESLRSIKESVELSDWPGTLRLPRKSIDTYYRIAIALAHRVSPDHDQLLNGFSDGVATKCFGRHAAVEALRSGSRAMFAQAVGDQRAALVHQREGALWHLAAVLAEEHGEGYPGIKWTVEKAARALGRDSPALSRALAPLSNGLTLRAERIEDLVTNTLVPESVCDLMSAYTVSPIAGGRLMRTRGSALIISADKMVSRPDELDMRILEGLDQSATGDGWRELVAVLAGELGIMPWVAAIALRNRISRLDARGLVVVEGGL